MVFSLPPRWGKGRGWGWRHAASHLGARGVVASMATAPHGVRPPPACLHPTPPSPSRGGLSSVRPMPLILTEEQTMLKEAADGILNEKAPIAHLRKLRDSRDPAGVSRELWRAFGEMGFAGVIIPEAHGGSGLGAVEAGVVAEALGRTLTP